MRQKGPVFITGASGFLGSYLCRYFSERDFQVIALEGPSGKSWRLPDSVERVRFDLTSTETLKTFLKESKPRIILNCAAYGAYSNQTDSDRIYQVNFEAVRTILENLHLIPGFQAFIQAGSSSEYGLNCTAPTENSPTIPDSNYAVSKIAVSALVQYYGKKLNLPTWAFRLYSVYGPWEDPTRLIPKLLIYAKEGKLPPLVDPKISRDFIFLEDVARAYEMLIEKSHLLEKGEIFNIGTGIKTTLGNLVSCAQETFQISAQPEWGSMAARHWDHPDWFANPLKAEAVLGWKATVPLNTGLRATMSWMQEYPEHFDEGLRNSVLGDIKSK